MNKQLKYRIPNHLQLLWSQLREQNFNRDMIFSLHWQSYQQPYYRTIHQLNNYLENSLKTSKLNHLESKIG